MKRRFVYPRAGAGAQREVRQAIRRFRELPPNLRASFPSLWGWLLGPEGTPPYKVDPDEIEVAGKPVNGQRCGNCTRWYVHHVTGTGICDSVQGVWPKQAWCQLWAPAVDKAEYQRYQRGEASGLSSDTTVTPGGS